MDRLWARLAAGPRRPVATPAAVALLAGAAILAGTAPATAAPVLVSVNCATTNLQTAIDAAPAGATLNVTGTCTGTFTIAKNLSLIGQGTAQLNGNFARAATVTTGSGATVLLANFTITGGQGGILNSGTLTVRGSRITGNGQPPQGGGIYNNGGTVTLNSSPVTSNSGRRGGGIYNGGTMTLNNSPVSNNGAMIGGGIDNTGTLTLNNSAVTGNTGGMAGGGIFNGGTATLNTSPVTGNSSSTGGGIYGGGVTLNDSQVTGNTPDNCAPPGSVPDCAG